MSTIKLENINFHYRKNEPVLKDINIEVPQGSIYGFLGANGAGKSTTLRLILGLMTPQAGSVYLFGENIKKSYPKHLSRVGSLIESASLYGHLSAAKNLSIASKYHRGSVDNIESMLELVNLDGAKNKKVADFSTGMKQRLGLAISLLHNPDILILDEPTNGLDPNGIIALREIIERLKNEGKTILLSSHILSEVEKIVDRIGIINAGKVVFEGSLQELHHLKGQNQKVKFRVSDVSKIESISPGYEISRIDDEQFTVQNIERPALAQLVKTLTENDISIYEVMPLQNDLEKMFLNVTNN